MEKYDFIVIGGGPGGLTRALRRQTKRGLRGAVLEQAAALGQGLSWRPSFNPTAIIHAGWTFPPESERKKICDQMYDLLHDPAEKNDPLMKIIHECSTEVWQIEWLRMTMPIIANDQVSRTIGSQNIGSG